MPHFHIEYSANLEEIVNMGQLCEAIRAEAASIAAFPMPGIRVRAICVEHYATADGDPKHGFVDLSIRLREGRTKEAKLDALERVFDVLKGFMSVSMASHSIALSAEMRDINAELSRKTGTIRDHLEITA